MGLAGTLRMTVACAALLVVAASCAPQTVSTRASIQSITSRTPDFATLLRRADEGDALAQARVGLDYTTEALQGAEFDRSRNAAEALRWLRAAAAQGNADGENGLGVLYQLGLGIPTNNQEALRWYKRAADQGLADAQVSVGLAYINGRGAAQNYSSAREMFAAAAAQNNGRAEFQLGMMYDRGQGVAVDYAEATRLIRRAADKGDLTAQASMGARYAEGRGVTRDYRLAYFWYNLAAARLIGGGQIAVAANRDDAAKKLGSDEIAQAQTLARDWKNGAAEMTEAALKAGPPPSAVANAADAAGAPALFGRRLLSSGTGFAVSRSGYVLTNAHVINECGVVHARVGGADDETAEIVAKDVANDLAVLRVKATLPGVASFRSDQAVRQGDGVVIYGFPLVNTLADEGNLTTGNVSALSGLQNDSRHLQISAPVQAGNSGGPLVDMSGNVIGVVVAKLNTIAITNATGDVPQNVNFAIKSSIARNFLDSNGIAYDVSPSTQAFGPSDIGERIRRVTVKVECWR